MDSRRWLAARFGRARRRNRRRAFAVRLAIDDKLMRAMAEAIKSALAEHGFIKDSHPFLHAAIRCED